MQPERSADPRGSGLGQQWGQVEEGIRCFSRPFPLYSSADDTVSRSGQIDTEPPRINHFYEQKLFLWENFSESSSYEITGTTIF